MWIPESHWLNKGDASRAVNLTGQFELIVRQTNKQYLCLTVDMKPVQVIPMQ